MLEFHTGKLLLSQHRHCLEYSHDLESSTKQLCFATVSETCLIYNNFLYKNAKRRNMLVAL